VWNDRWEPGDGLLVGVAGHREQHHLASRDLGRGLRGGEELARLRLGALAVEVDRLGGAVLLWRDAVKREYGMSAVGAAFKAAERRP